MDKKVFLAFFLFFLAANPLLLPVPGTLSSWPEQATPPWWDIKIVLYADGEYKLEQQKTSYLGNYSFKIIWTGSLEKEKNDEDYILYSRECQLLDWEAKEKKTSPELVVSKAGKDFEMRPTFHLNYILRKGANLHFDFIVEGFSVPQHESDCKIYLDLPCYSEKPELNPEIEYDSFLVKGSNQIILGEKEIYAGPVKKEFNWTWKLQKYTIDWEYPIRITNLHKASLEISITPHL